MATLLVQLLAAAAFLAVAFWLFRLAMGLRYAKVLREEARLRETARGRRLVAEVPTPAGDLQLFFEDDLAFHFGERVIPRQDVQAAQLILNGRVVGTRSRPGVLLPAGGPEEDYEGRERWDVILGLASGERLTIPCGTLREGVSREAARDVFDAVARALA